MRSFHSSIRAIRDIKRSDGESQLTRSLYSGGEDAVIEIRGQQATDWRDIYEIRTATANALPCIRPDWVKAELAEIQDGTWPMVAVVQSPGGPKVVARVNVQLGRGRRAHAASLTLERHPAFGDEPGRRLLREAIDVAENWWNRHRLATSFPANSPALIALCESFGFLQEARLRQGVRIGGELVDEVVLARLTGEAAQRNELPPPMLSGNRPTARPTVIVRGGSADDWESFHNIWSQPSVVWGTVQIPYPSADWNRERVQERTPPGFWPIVAEIDGKLVGTAGFHRDEHNRSHVGHVGMMVHADYQGEGIGSALMEAVIDLAENWLGVTRLQLEVYPDNARAIDLYEKHGFETEGLHRSFSYRDGHYVDALVMSRLR
jgi:putative acetyltransferase